MTIHTLLASSGTKALGGREEAPIILTLAVENMRCGGCIRSVERAAMSVPGVRSARANLAAKRVSVGVDDGRASEADVIAALAQAGFAAAPMQYAAQHAETSRESALLRRVAVAAGDEPARHRPHEHHLGLAVRTAGRWLFGHMRRRSKKHAFIIGFCKL